MASAHSLSGDFAPLSGSDEGLCWRSTMLWCFPLFGTSAKPALCTDDTPNSWAICMPRFWHKLLRMIIKMVGFCIAQTFLSRKLNALAHTIHANIYDEVHSAVVLYGIAFIFFRLSRAVLFWTLQSDGWTRYKTLRSFPQLSDLAPTSCWSDLGSDRQAMFWRYLTGAFENSCCTGSSHIASV